MPLFHTMGLRTLLATVLAGGTWVPQARFDAGEAAELIVRERISSLYLVPDDVLVAAARRRPGRARGRPAARLRGRGDGAGAGRAAHRGGRPRDVRQPLRLAPRSTRSPSARTSRRSRAARAGRGCSAGSGSSTRRPGPPPTPRSRRASRGRWSCRWRARRPSPATGCGPDATERAVRDGWYFTGDLAVADDDGDLWVSGRVDDMINTGGENVYPDEIEAALVCCPAVADVVVVGLPDERWGQAVTAFVVPGRRRRPRRRPSPPTDAWARRILPSLRRPKRVVAVDAVPRSAVGKTLRRAARRRATSTALADTAGSRAMTWTPARDEDAALVSGAGPLRRRPRPAARDAGGGDRAQPAPARPHPRASTSRGPARTPASPR